MPKTTSKSEQARILLVDDDAHVRKTMEGILKHSYDITTASNGKEALALVSKEDFDLMLLDIHMPDHDGLEVLEATRRQKPQTVVIMLTGFASVDNAVHALRHGAFDYLQKPISNEELVERVSQGLITARRERERDAVLLKAQQLLSEGLRFLNEATPEQVDLLAEGKEDERSSDPERFLQRGPLVIDTYRRKATLRGELLDLTAGEYDLLLCLAQEAPRVLDPQELVKKTRGYECSLSEARELIRWQVYLLRQKVEIDPSNPQCVLNVRGQGYVWAEA